MAENFTSKTVRIPSPLARVIEEHIETEKQRGNETDFSKFARTAFREKVARLTNKRTNAARRAA